MTPLECKVMAVNSVNDYANKLYDILAPVFRGWLNCYITNKTVYAIKKEYEKYLPDFPVSEDVHLQAFYQITDYSISVCIRTYSQDNNDIAHYYDISLYLVNLQDRKAMRIYEKDQLRTDYTKKEVWENRQAFLLAKQDYDKAKSKLYPFGENDN